MLKKIKLFTAAIFFSSFLFDVPNVTIHGCSKGSFNAATNVLHVYCKGQNGDCVVLSAGVAPNGYPGWLLSVNWACNGGGWQNFWLIQYPKVNVVEEDETEIIGDVILGM